MLRPCVIARLAGGLGNQLFMYAFAKALAARNSVPLFLDTHSGFTRDRTYRRTFLLDYLIPPEPRASLTQLRAWPLIGRTLQSWDRRRNAKLPLEARYYLRERCADFDEAVYRLPITHPVIFDGYWQSERYFDDLPLRDLLHFPSSLTNPLAEELATIESACAPVCLAVRRYEEIPRHKRPTLILDADYYHRAMAQLEQSVDNPHYFVFAQDMRWARENLSTRHPISFASEKNVYAGAIQDLYLMSRCQHHIISNSTLHWWGAWLNSRPNGVVVSPVHGWHCQSMLRDAWLKIK